MDQAQSENLLLNDILKYECEFELNDSIDDSVSVTCTGSTFTWNTDRIINRIIQFEFTFIFVECHSEVDFHFELDPVLKEKCKKIN